ncbi:hypothetical protein [uncultured Sulfitobacter sp.]|uniref:hypothetical protein n=1 Tax=uncultured Sulfitobacter sp. TaxID=191468 RepID=UPI00263270E0|nr:hypothetical protein [uncultured Sulfitobacter sp.]
MSEYKAIERTAAAERQELAASLDALSSAVNPENIQNHATMLAETYGGDIGRQAWGAAKQNPAAFALVGVGIGLLLTGTGTRPETRRPTPTLVPTEDAYVGFDARVAAADDEIKQEYTGMMQEDDTPRAAWLRTKLNDGLDTLSPAARTRVIAAREAVVDAQEKVEAQTRAAVQKSQTFMHDQPLAVGALALGLGALVGALLPSTRREDDLLGEHRDAAMARARATLQDEVNKAHAAAKSTLQGETQSAG